MFIFSELLTFVNHWPHSIHMTSGETLQLSCAVTLRSGFSLAWDKDGEVFRRSTVANDTNMTNGKLGKCNCKYNYYNQYYMAYNYLLNIFYLAVNIRIIKNYFMI